MSFSRDVKVELEAHLPKSRHCQVAELAALLSFAGKQVKIGDNTLLELCSDNDLVVKKYATLLHKTLNIDKDVALEPENNSKIRQSAKVSCDKMNVDSVVLQQTCCKRSFIRGAFLVAGSISDPNKAYHFEIVCQTKEQAVQLQECMSVFEVEPKIVTRSGKYVVYIKEGSQIVEMLGVMEASRSVLEIENIRIVKEMRGSINRKVNCETANIGKTVGAALRQVEDIQYLDREIGLDNLPESLQEIAKIRLDNPDTPLKELGEKLDPPLGKSGVNHRLRRLSEMAEKLREEITF